MLYGSSEHCVQEALESRVKSFFFFASGLRQCSGCTECSGRQRVFEIGFDGEMVKKRLEERKVWAAEMTDWVVAGPGVACCG